MSFVKQHVLRAVFSFALVLAFALPANAQEIKIGVVSFQVLVERAPQTKAAMDALQEEFAPRQREFLAKQKEFEELTAKVQKDVAVMGETERRNATTTRSRELERGEQQSMIAEAQEIITEVFSDAGIPENMYEFSLNATYPPREYCVQYRESEWDFIQRLLDQFHFHCKNLN